MDIMYAAVDSRGVSLSPACLLPLFCVLPISVYFSWSEGGLGTIRGDHPAAWHYSSVEQSPAGPLLDTSIQANLACSPSVHPLQASQALPLLTSEKSIR